MQMEDIIPSLYAYSFYAKGVESSIWDSVSGPWVHTTQL